MRRKMQKQPVATPSPPQAAPVKTKFGSFNVNGLDVESSWAVQQLLVNKGFDVSNT